MAGSRLTLSMVGRRVSQRVCARKMTEVLQNIVQRHQVHKKIFDISSLFEMCAYLWTSVSLPQHCCWSPCFRAARPSSVLPMCMCLHVR